MKKILLSGLFAAVLLSGCGGSEGGGGTPSVLDVSAPGKLFMQWYNVAYIGKPTDKTIQELPIYSATISLDKAGVVYDVYSQQILIPKPTQLLRFEANDPSDNVILISNLEGIRLSLQGLTSLYKPMTFEYADPTTGEWTKGEFYTLIRANPDEAEKIMSAFSFNYTFKPTLEQWQASKPVCTTSSCTVRLSSDVQSVKLLNSANGKSY